MRSPLLSRWLTCAQALVAVGLLLGLAACSPGAGTGAQISSTPTNTPVTTAPTPTPTQAPPVCGANFKDPTYYSTLPGATFQTTNVYAQVPMPPLTRAYDDDASGGVRGRHLCSAGTDAAVLAFMTDHLTQLGWTQTPQQNTTACLGAAGYGQPECWTNGQYGLSLGINSSTDWLIVFRDPDVAASVNPFQVTSVDLTVSPGSLAGQACGSSVTFTYTATFHLAANGPGGTIQFEYTLNNGRSSTPASVAVAAGQTTKVFTFTSSGTLPADHTYPGVAEVIVTGPDSVDSPQVIPSGACGTAAFKVTSVTMAVSPTTIAGRACGTQTTVTYTATFHIAANGPGGTIQFEYTVNNGRGSTSASIAVAAGQTTATYSFTWSGKLPTDHTYPEPGGVIVDSPNQVNSPLVAPAGSCS